MFRRVALSLAFVGTLVVGAVGMSKTADASGCGRGNYGGGYYGTSYPAYYGGHGRHYGPSNYGYYGGGYGGGHRQHYSGGHGGHHGGGHGGISIRF